MKNHRCFVRWFALITQNQRFFVEMTKGGQTLDQPAFCSLTWALSEGHASLVHW